MNLQNALFYTHQLTPWTMYFDHVIIYLWPDVSNKDKLYLLIEIYDFLVKHFFMLLLKLV